MHTELRAASPNRTSLTYISLSCNSTHLHAFCSNFEYSFAILDRDNDNIITFREFCGFLHLITSIGWSYSKQTYTRSGGLLFSTSYRRTTPSEMAELLLSNVREARGDVWTEYDEVESGVDWECFKLLSLSLV